MLKPSQCEGCAIRGAGYDFIPPDAVGDRVRVVVWGEAGGQEEARMGRGFVGPSGREIRRALRQAGVPVWNAWPGSAATPRSQEEAAFWNVLRCRPPGNRFPPMEVATGCLKRFSNGQWPLEKPWLVCGANATEALTGYRLDTLKARGSVVPIRDQEKWAVITVHPAYLIRGRDEYGEMGKAVDWLKPILALDTRRAMASADGPRVPLIRFTQDPHEVHARWLATANSKLFAVDIEGKPEEEPKILGVAWETEKGISTWTMPWSPACVGMLNQIIPKTVPVLHNASYDVPELQAVGVTTPTAWVDTINLAALYDPGIPKNLQTQVLTHVIGSTAWKGLVNHQHGAEYEGGKHGVYRRLWEDILNRLGRSCPESGQAWFYFYNGLDVAWTLALSLALRTKLKQQGRHLYYQQLMGPLQPYLLSLGQGGLPVDVNRIQRHREGCQRLIRMASGILAEAGNIVLEKAAREARKQVDLLVAERDEEREAAGKRVAFSRAKELTSARNRLKTAEKNLEAGFNFDSNPQCVALLYDHYGLPPVMNRDSRKPTTNDAAIESLLLRLTKVDEQGNPAPTIKPKGRKGRALIPEVVRILRAKRAAKKWATWERNFLRVAVVPRREI